MIYEMVCGTLPFGANNPNAVMAQIIYGSPTPLEQHLPSVPADLQAVVHRALERDLDKRYATMREFRDALTACSLWRDVTPEIAASLLPRPSSFDGISDILPAEFRDDGGGAAPVREPTVQPEVAAEPRPLRMPTAHLDVAPIGRPRAPGNVARAAAALLCGALALLGVMHWF